MCGIAGILSHNASGPISVDILQRMARTLVHRGPDSERYWQGPDVRVNLGHRRLEIIDLTPSGTNLCSRRTAGKCLVSMVRSTIFLSCVDLVPLCLVRNLVLIEFSVTSRSLPKRLQRWIEAVQCLVWVSIIAPLQKAALSDGK
jgi:hypothetical protein